MKKIEKIQLIEGGQQYEVRELTGEDMMNIFSMFKPSEKDSKKAMQGLLNRESLLKNFDKILPLATDIPKDVLLKLAPSEMEAIWEKFKEVNAVFFSKSDFLIDKFDMKELWIQARKTLQSFYLGILSSYIDKVLQDAKNGDMEK